MTAVEPRIVRGEVLPPEGRRLLMPAGTPFGIAVLGAMKFNAIRRVIDQYERALRSKEIAILAETAVARALVARELAREQLLALDTLRENERDRIESGVALEKMRRRLEHLEIEERLIEAEERKSRGSKLAKEASPDHTSETRDEFSAFVSDLAKLPGVVAAAAAAKAQIVKDAGGEDKLTESGRQACDMLDTMLQSFISKKAGDTAL